jgi:hypothetical protein
MKPEASPFAGLRKGWATRPPERKQCASRASLGMTGLRQYMKQQRDPSTAERAVRCAHENQDIRVPALGMTRLTGFEGSIERVQKDDRSEARPRSGFFASLRMTTRGLNAEPQRDSSTPGRDAACTREEQRRPERFGMLRYRAPALRMTWSPARRENSRSLAACFACFARDDNLSHGHDPLPQGASNNYNKGQRAMQCRG